MDYDRISARSDIDRTVDRRRHRVEGSAGIPIEVRLAVSDGNAVVADTVDKEITVEAGDRVAGIIDDLYADIILPRSEVAVQRQRVGLTILAERGGREGTADPLAVDE